MKNMDGYLIETHPDLFEKLKSLIALLDEVISCESEVKKLKEHPIKDWHQYLFSDIYFDKINMAQLMMNDKEITELFDDFKNSKNIKLKKLLKFDTCSIIFHSLFTKKTCGINMLANVDP